MSTLRLIKKLTEKGSLYDIARQQAELLDSVLGDSPFISFNGEDDDFAVGHIPSLNIRVTATFRPTDTDPRARPISPKRPGRPKGTKGAYLLKGVPLQDVLPHLSDARHAQRNRWLSAWCQRHRWPKAIDRPHRSTVLRWLTKYAAEIDAYERRK